MWWRRLTKLYGGSHARKSRETGWSIFRESDGNEELLTSSLHPGKLLLLDNRTCMKEVAVRAAREQFSYQTHIMLPVLPMPFRSVRYFLSICSVSL